MGFTMEVSCSLLVICSSAKMKGADSHIMINWENGCRYRTNRNKSSKETVNSLSLSVWLAFKSCSTRFWDTISREGFPAFDTFEVLIEDTTSLRCLSASEKSLSSS